MHQLKISLYLNISSIILNILVFFYPVLIEGSELWIGWPLNALAILINSFMAFKLMQVIDRLKKQDSVSTNS